jgi:hypothetical protein
MSAFFSFSCHDDSSLIDAAAGGVLSHLTAQRELQRRMIVATNPYTQNLLSANGVRPATGFVASALEGNG